MPASLKLLAGLLLLALASAPISLAVQHRQEDKAARAAAAQLTGGDPAAGKAAMMRYGCDACHSASSTTGTAGKVGPPLAGFAERTEIAGRLANQPQNLILWIRHPQAINRGGGMPDMGVTDKDGRDIAAYLYTLKGG